MTELCVKVKNYINCDGHSLSWIAQKAVEAGAPKSFDGKKLSAILRGKRNLDADEFLFICKALNVNPDIFLNSA